MSKKLFNYYVNPNDYIVEKEEIGKGNFGSVSLVHPKNDKQKKIALKQIPIDYEDQELSKSFIREITIMANLRHPNLLDLVGFAIPTNSDQTFKIYSKFLPNKTLIEVLKQDEKRDKSKKILNPTRLSIIVYGIASAMQYLHKNQIVHRDLKPENVFLNEQYHPVLSDFGLSRICNELAMTSKLGTPYFMAPELFDDDESKVTNKIDVYAFSITLLSLFTTNYRFKGPQPNNLNRLIEYITSDKRYEIPSSTPSFYSTLIKKCWSSDFTKRPSFDEIVKELEENDNFMFEGADKKKVRSFIVVTKSMSDPNEGSSKSTSLGSSKSSSEFEETQEFNFVDS